jgi:sulfur transfer complex TusBCD TusB component (DsrH family)
MKKTNLKWRLSKLPSSEEVLALIKDGVITKEEGKEILFSEETEETKSITDLQSEIKFLKELVERLSSNRNQIVETIKIIEKPYYQKPWYQPYYYWQNQDNIVLCSNGSTILGADSNVTNLSASSFSQIS